MPLDGKEIVLVPMDLINEYYDSLLSVMSFIFLANFEETAEAFLKSIFSSCMVGSSIGLLTFLSKALAAVHPITIPQAVFNIMWRCRVRNTAKN